MRNNFWPIFHFGLSSIGCMVIDQGVFTAVCLPLEHVWGRATAIAVAIPAARIVSGHCNFFYNQRFVFKNKHTWPAYFKYWTLVAINASLLMVFTQVVSAVFDAKGLWITLVNFCGEVCLFLFSFTMQKLVVFRKEKRNA